MTAVRIGAKLPSSGVSEDGRRLAELAHVAEQSGFDGVWVSDHVVMPRETTSPYPFSPDGSMSWQPESPWVDALVAMSAAASATQRVDVGVGVLIVPMRNPLVLAKQLASLDLLSGGRIVVGVGAGWLREEFEALHASFDERGAILDEWIDILRECWTGQPRARDGGHYPVPEGVLCYPTPVQPPPILIGGMSSAALRRVAGGGDGWFALQHAHEIDPKSLEAAVRRIRSEAEALGREPPRRAGIRIPGPISVVADHLAALVEAGITDVVVDVDWKGEEPRRIAETLHTALP